MNFMMKAGMNQMANQMKDQAQALIPNELQDKSEENKKNWKMVKLKEVIRLIKIK